jgi:hypothetical protein
MMDEWVSLRTGGRESWGLLRDDGVADLGAVLAPALPDLRSMIAATAQHQGLRAISAWMRRPCSGFPPQGRSGCS